MIMNKSMIRGKPRQRVVVAAASQAIQWTGV